MLERITVHGARQHNLKNINLEIPRNSLTVVTGLSGSGKIRLPSIPFMRKDNAAMSNRSPHMLANFSISLKNPT